MGILARRKWLLMGASLLAVLFAQPFFVREAQSRSIELFEEKIKAGLVYNFLKYTTWPSAASATQKGSLKVCLFGSNPVNEYLAPLAGKHAQQFIIDIIRVNGIEETKDCSLIFISSSKKDNLDELLAFLQDKHVLTVSDIQEFASQGGMVELAKENQRIIFYINTKAVRLAGLDIGDRLLKLAKRVSG